VKPWHRIRRALFFALILPVPLILLILTDGDLEALFMGPEWIKACAKGIKDSLVV